jgi:isoamylase
MMHARPTRPEFSYSLPFGAIVHHNGVQFSVFSRSATAMRLLIYEDVNDPDPVEVIDMDPKDHRFGDVWSVFLPGAKPGLLYHFQADGPYDPDRGHRFDGRARLIDPYAKALAGDFLPAVDGSHPPPEVCRD